MFLAFFKEDGELSLNERKVLAFTWLGLGGRVMVDGYIFQGCNPTLQTKSMCNLDFDKVLLRKLTPATGELAQNLALHIHNTYKEEHLKPNMKSDQDGNIIWEK